MSNAPVKSSAATSRRVPARHYLLFVVIASGGCAVDLLTKHYIFRWRGMPGDQSIWWLWQPYVGIETSLNPGALFGMGAGFRPVFIAASVVAAVWIVYWAFGHARAAVDLLFTIPLAMILAGILGNLYDRLGWWHPPHRPGAWNHLVRDWILFRYGRFTWPNFNIADSLLVCGVAFLIARAFCVPVPKTGDEVSHLAPMADKKTASSAAHSK